MICMKIPTYFTTHRVMIEKKISLSFKFLNRVYLFGICGSAALVDLHRHVDEIEIRRD